MATIWSPETIAKEDFIAASHISSLVTALNAERNRRSLATFTLSPTAGNIDQASDINTVRSNITEFSTFTLTDNPIIGSNSNFNGATLIKAAHISEIRSKINALEAHPYEGGATDCNAGCTGLCVSCTSTCGSSCAGTCTNSCTGTCSGQCQSGCSGCSGCGGGCTNCTGSCLGSCSGGCSGGCTGCGSACTSGCSGCSGYY